MSVRVRFPPSPTGNLHVGTGRTVLYNWLFARHHGGAMVFRVDDTDTERSTEEFLQDIIEGLRWLGIDWDEGIVVGGPLGEYRQSRRLDRYQEVARQLVAAGWAYYDFATPEQLEGLRAAAVAAGRSPGYDGTFRLPAAEAAARVAAGEKAPIRFAVPRPGETAFTDAIRGEMRFDHANVDDFVLLRSDGTPTYHLASSVDDVDHAITHIIRGEDLLPSTPKHLLIARAMGAPEPVYAHLSLLTGPDGAKLSKRHGATSLRAYRDEGILAEAMRNYLAILGWSPGTDEEIVTLESMVARFDLGAVSKNPAVFDVTKLEWMNGVYIRALPAEEFTARALPFVEMALGRPLEPGEPEVFASVAPLVQERARRLTEVGAQVRFLFSEVEMDPASWLAVMTTAEAPGAVEGARAALAGLSPWDKESIEGALRAMLEARDLSARKGLQPIRVAVTGSTVSPPLFESLVALGPQRTLERLDAAAGRLRGGPGLQ
ncbi:MAG: glutamyl-tRNA synthetase [Acidobacteria bacterium]|nr:glutamyl-tRNA synthetase [Acidobacteriota bacterium]